MIKKASTSSEYIASIIQETIPDSNFRNQIQSTANRYLEQMQDDLSFGFLPTVIYSAISGDTEKAIPITAAWQLIQVAAKLFDDVEDGETTERIADATNLATGFLFTAHAALDRLVDYGVSLDQSHRMKVGLNQACLCACAGQDADLQIRHILEPIDPDCWLEIARRKSGELFAWASQAGGIVAGVSETVQENLWECGLRLGTLVQIADDFNGIWGPAGEIDLFNGQWTLPIIYAFYVANPLEKKVFDGLIKSAAQGDRHAAHNAREQISSLGAQKYVLAVAYIQRSEAIEILDHIPLSPPARQRLVVILDRVFPVLAQVGAPSYGSNTEAIIVSH